MTIDKIMMKVLWKYGKGGTDFTWSNAENLFGGGGFKLIIEEKVRVRQVEV